MKNNAFLAVLLSFCIFLPALAQTQTQNKPAAPQPPPQKPADDQDEVVKITTNLVQVDAVVTKDGKMVTNLTADDFEIYEDGKKQEITSFAFISNVAGATPPPVTPTKEKPGSIPPARPINPNEPHRTIAFVVDDLGTSAESMSQVRKQLRKFVNERLQPNDLVAIIRTGGEMGALQQFTNDKRILSRAVDQLRWNLCNRVGITVLAPLESAGPALCGRFSMLATIRSLRFILDAMAYLPGRKSMVFMSDHLPVEDQDELNFMRDVRNGGGVKDDAIQNAIAGVAGEEPSNIDLQGTNYSAALRKIAEKAIRSSVVIYSVDTQGLQTTGLTAADRFYGTGPQFANVIRSRSLLLWSRREGSDLIAKQTGGFQVKNSNSYDIDRIVQDQSGYYLLGYRPTDETFNRKFHHIKAKVKQSGMSLRTRLGFFGVTEEEASRSEIGSHRRSDSAGEFVTVPDLKNKRLAVSGIVLSSGSHEQEAMSNTVARRFNSNSDLEYGYVVYNAMQFAKPVMETKLFRDGKEVFSGPEAPIQVSGQPDPERVLASGKLRLGPELEPGFYYLQVLITDKEAKSKAPPVVQWIDFEVVKPEPNGGGK